MDKLIEELLRAKLIDVGEVRVARATLTGVRGKARYLVYLPTPRNYVWKVLHESNERVRLYVEVPESVLTKLKAKEEAD